MDSLNGGWKLTKKQQTAAQLYALYPKMSQSKICQEIGCSEQWFSYTKRKPEWQEYVTSILNEQWKDSIREAQQQMLNLMRNGDYRATQYILDSAGYGAVQKVNVVADNVITIEILDD